ncbi:MAG: Transposase family, partial [Solirubrobacteraceae bacterium]|nr:Transposase family [Solirubrobacteraceae bacterium]
VPSRQQSGETDTHGPITKTGSRYARRILVEASWHYLRAPRVGGGDREILLTSDRENSPLLIAVSR